MIEFLMMVVNYGGLFLGRGFSVLTVGFKAKMLWSASIYIFAGLR
jgi:hypothetical protein